MTVLSHYTPGAAGTAGDGFRVPAPRDPQPAEQRPPAAARRDRTGHTAATEED